MTRWRMPPENWCGIVVEPRRRASGCRPSRELAPCGARLARDLGRSCSRALGDLRADPHDRVQRRHRILEDDGDRAAADFPQSVDHRAYSRSVPLNGCCRRRCGPAATGSAAGSRARRPSCRCRSHRRSQGIRHGRPNTEMPLSACTTPSTVKNFVSRSRTSRSFDTDPRFPVMTRPARPAGNAYRR